MMMRTEVVLWVVVPCSVVVGYNHFRELCCLQPWRRRQCSPLKHL